MANPIPTAVQEVLDFAEQEALFSDPTPARLGSVVLASSPSEARRWISGEQRPSGAALSEDEPDWLDLRQSMAAEVLGDLYDGALTRAQWDAIEREVETRLEAALSTRLPTAVRDFLEDIFADLVNCARARLAGSKGVHREFFEHILRAYQAGVLPCGWDGVYPDGRLAVLLPDSAP